MNLKFNAIDTFLLIQFKLNHLIQLFIQFKAIEADR